MQNPTTIKEAFLPLAKRVLEYEIGTFNNDEDSRGIEQFENLIKDVSLSAKLFDDELIYKEASKYLELIRAIKTDLNGKLDAIDGVPINIKEYLVGLYTGEINLYLRYLKVLKENSEKSIEPNSIKSQAPPVAIYLPENFKAPQIQKHFDPVLSPEEVSLFLNYLRELEIMPPFHNSQITLLSPSFFGVSNNTSREVMSDIPQLKKDKSFLLPLKKSVEEILLKINSDIKEAS